ncbi:MAG: hypothetical protein ACRDGG_06860, partial [Anaerolineae bacterium]
MNDLAPVLLVLLLATLAFGYRLWRQSQREIEQLRRDRTQLARDREAESRQAAHAQAWLAALGQAVLEAIVIV